MSAVWHELRLEVKQFRKQAVRVLEIEFLNLLDKSILIHCSIEKPTLVEDGQSVRMMEGTW